MHFRRMEWNRDTYIDKQVWTQLIIKAELNTMPKQTQVKTKARAKLLRNRPKESRNDKNETSWTLCHPICISEPERKKPGSFSWIFVCISQATVKYQQCYNLTIARSTNVLSLHFNYFVAPFRLISHHFNPNRFLHWRNAFAFNDCCIQAMTFDRTWSHASEILLLHFFEIHTQ